MSASALVVFDLVAAPLSGMCLTSMRATRMLPAVSRRDWPADSHVWRNRVLDPVTTVHLFVLQAVHGNTAYAHVPHLGGVRCSGAAYGQARARLPLAVLERLLRGIVERLRGPALDEGRWRGHRTFLADGSGVSMPDTPALQVQFGQPAAQKAGCGFPIMHVLALFHATTGLLLRVTAAPLRTHNMSQIGQLHPERAAGDVLVGDRAFCSFAHLALLTARQIRGVFRVHQQQIVDFRPRRKAASAGSRQRGDKGRPTSRG